MIAIKTVVTQTTDSVYLTKEKKRKCADDEREDAKRMDEGLGVSTR